MYGRLQKYTGLQTNGKKKKIVILILCVLVEATRILPGQQKPQKDAYDFFSTVSIVYREGGFVLCFTDGKRKRTEGSARHFTETHLTGDQIIEHFSLKNNVQM